MTTEKIFIVRVSNGASYSPSFPYEGTEKDIAIAIATAYIARNRNVKIIEKEQALSEGGK